MAKKFYRLNHQITAKKLRLIDDKGKQVDIVPLEKALELALEEGLDLVEIAPQADPPVVKIIDYKKFLYDEKRKEKEARKKLKEVELKQVKVGPFISEHDLKTKLDQAREFLKDGNHVKITVKFTGRQMAHTEFGFKLLEKIKEEFAEIANIEREERLEGRNLNTLFAPGKNAKAKD